MDLLVVVLTVLFGYALWKLVQFFNKCKKTQRITAKTDLFPQHLLWGHLYLFNDVSEYVELFTAKVQKTRCKIYSMCMTFIFPLYTAVHPDTIKILLKSSEPKPKGLITGLYRMLLPWLGDGLLVSNEAKWERNRRLLTPAFHFDILMPYVNIYNKVADILIEKLSDMSTTESVEICNPISQATLDTMLRCSLSYEGRIQEEGVNHPYLSAVKELSHLFIQRSLRPWLYMDLIYFSLPSGRRFKELCNYVHDFADSIIASRKQALLKNPEQLKKRRLDFLDILLTARDEHDMGLTDMEIRAEVDTFLFEGHDTTASALSWAIYCLAKYPKEQQKVYEEVTDVLNDKEYLEWEDLPKVKYLQLFIKEVMRYHSPVPLISRILTKDTQFGDVMLPEGSVLDVGIVFMNHHPDVWSDHDIFNPGRFRDERGDKDPYSYVPFSAGPRNCIGQNFAMNEQKVILSRLVKRFRIKLDEKHEVKPLPEVVMRAKDGIKVYLEQR